MPTRSDGSYVSWDDIDKEASRGSGSSSSGGPKNSGSSSSGSSSKSGSSSSSGSSKSKNKGYAYTDKYGYSHVTYDQDTANEYGRPGSVQDYFGNYSGGYARDSAGNRLAVATKGAIDYGNDMERGGTRWDMNPNNYGIGMAFQPTMQQQALQQVYQQQRPSYTPIQNNPSGGNDGYTPVSQPQPYNYNFNSLPGPTATASYTPIQLVDEDTQRKIKEYAAAILAGQNPAWQ